MRSVLNEENAFSVLRDIITSIGKVRDNSKEKEKNSKYYLGGSISRYAKNLVMSFPVLCDETLSVETSQWISKACEKNTASLLELMFSSMSINTYKDSRNGKDVLRLFHQNIDGLNSMEDIIDYTNDFVAARKESYIPDINQGAINDINREFLQELKQPAKVFKENFAEKGLNEYLVRPDYYGSKLMVFEAPSKYLEKERAIKEEARMKEVARLLEEEALINEELQLGVISEAPSDYVEGPDGTLYDANVSDRERFLYQKALDAQRQQNSKREMDQDQREFEYKQKYTDVLNVQQKRVKDAEYKKANELQPTMLIVNFNVLGEGDKLIERKSFVAGVKCRMIPCSSVDIMERVMSVNKQQISFKNLIRATTGEISFKNDFILATSQQKLDAKNDIKRGEAAKVWNCLKRRSTANSYRKIARDKNDASAITTLVVSQETANYIKASNNFDISTPKGALQVMNAYNLLCIVIADETNEVAKFLYDGNSDFESLSFTVLAKEAMDKQYKKIVNVLK